MWKYIGLSIWLIVSLCEAYQVSLSKTSVGIGETVTVSWTGQCSHDDWTGCYDWISAYQEGACEDGSPIPSDTCYMTNDWNWVSHLGSKWNYQFDAPGKYEFRIPYCGCDECNIITSDFAECSSYESYGESAVITVNPPFSISNFNPIEQFLLGILYVEFEGNNAKLSGVTKPTNTCASCLCAAETAASYLEKTVASFVQLCSGFSMTGLRTSLGYLQTALQDSLDALRLCGVEKTVVDDIAKATVSIISGLEEVEAIVDIIIEGEKMFSDISNTIESWRLGNYFASGVNAGRSINDILAALDLKMRAVAGIRSKGCGIRHPGGNWTSCNCDQKYQFAKFPGNKCRNMTLAH